MKDSELEVNYFISGDKNTGAANIYSVDNFLKKFKDYKFKNLEDQISNGSRYLSIYRPDSKEENLGTPSINQLRKIARTSAIMMKEWNYYMKSENGYGISEEIYTFEEK